MSNIVSIARRRYKKAKELFLPIEEKIEINRNLYRGVVNTDESFEWDYALADQQVFPLIRNYISRTNLAHLEVKLEARKPEDKETRDINQYFINWELNEFHKTMQMIRMAFSSYVAGRGILKTGWLYAPKVKISVDGKKQFIMRDITNRADAKFVRYNDVIPANLNIPTLKDQPYIFEVMSKRVGEMLDENEAEEYWDKKFLKHLKKSGITGKTLDFQMEAVKDEDLTDDLSFRSAMVALVCMHTIDGDVIYFPLDDAEWEKPVNLIQENRYWHGHYPYVDFPVFPEDDRYDSLSVVDAVADLQIAASDVLNQQLTNLRQINNSMWIKGSAAASTPDWQFSSRPNGVISVEGDISQIQQIRPQDNAGTSLRIAQDLTGKIEKVGGISSLYSSGVPGAKINQTARGAQIIDQNIETNMQLILDIIGEKVVKELAEHFMELNAQYVTEEQTFAITGKQNVSELITINPEQISANFEVYANTDKFAKQTPASKQVTLQNMITQLMNIGNQTQVEINFPPLLEALVAAHPDTQNLGEDIVVTVDEKFARDKSSIERGQLPIIKVRDPHMELLQLTSLTIKEEQYPPEVLEVWQKYAEKHMAFLQSAKEIRAMSNPQMPQNQSPSQLMGDPLAAGGVGGGEVPGVEGMPEPNMGTYNLGNIV
jgi:hypothetical protein